MLGKDDLAKTLAAIVLEVDPSRVSYPAASREAMIYEHQESRQKPRGLTVPFVILRFFRVLCYAGGAKIIDVGR
ncbi:MAG TPA: hypothetical protein VN445_05225 [Rectinemataceae bacterium]|nr:hypothetical protein [Rectinemataceae bacterium]